jgi:phosphoserine phosphatase
MNKLIVFDLDNTLTEGRSWTRLNVGLGMTPDEDLRLSKEYYQAQKFTEWVAHIMGIYHKRGIPNKKNIEKILSTFRYITGAEECIGEIKKLGYYIAVISGAPDIFTELICRKLGINHFRSINTLVFDKNGLLIDITTEGEEELAKLKHYKNICNLVQVDIKQAVIVGDGDNEELLFNTSKYPITFKGGKLENKAWKTIYSLTDLPKILNEIPST